MFVSRRRRATSPDRAQRGFSLIEVMVAVLILAIGLLGFALMQTMGIRFAESSNYRTQAINLAYDLLDQMRANRLLAAQYQNATFASGTAPAACAPPTGTVTIATRITDWQCRVRLALGDGASASVTYNNGQATVTINWDDQRWEANSARKTGTFNTGQVSLGTQL
ncbi:type IV pilus modification protein PilV [Cognatilysobacter terrigena]|uniref:type IV pilus modification protein PilV n=1 Tax=Cognatilysobacter terrigena TaxID=2488749 RepID=UPI001060FBA7|nr:type IV pilus modification protein PilV [Lysobacter terrigena]